MQCPFLLMPTRWCKTLKFGSETQNLVPDTYIHRLDAIVTVMGVKSSSVAHNPIIALPSGWKRYKLTTWDCGPLLSSSLPVIAWVVEGSVNIDELSKCLTRAITRSAPYLGGRVARRESGHPRYEIHIPPPESNLPAFSQSVRDIPDAKLDSILSYTRSDSDTPTVRRFDYDQIDTIHPIRKEYPTAEAYAESYRPPLHLHFIRAKDCSLISLSWIHIVTDVHGIGQLINAWEEEITKRQIEQEDGSKLGSDTNIQNSVLAPADDGNNVLDFIASHKLELSWKCPRYYSPGFFDRVRMLLRGIYDRFRYGETDGSIFIPSLIVKRWVEDARKQLKAGEYVSTIDIVTAWIYKHAFEIYPSCSTSVLTTVFTLCGRIPSVLQTTFANAATCYVNPAIRTRHLRKTSLSSLALQIRQQFREEIIDNPENTLNYVAHRAQFEQNGELYIPCGRSSRDRCCFISSFANLQVSAPDFGYGRRCVVAALSYTENITGFCSLLNDLDEQGGGWRMHGKTTRRAWDNMEKALQNANA